MTENDAFRAMYFYLNDLWGRNPDIALGQLLGEIALLEDGKPADPAAARDWHRATQKALRESND